MNHALQTFKPDCEEARRHWEAFWAGELLDRPCISVIAPRDGAPEVPGQIYTEGHDGKYDEIAKRAEAWIASRFWGGDAIPRYVPSFGPDMFAGFIGAQLEYAPDTGTSWAVPFVENWKTSLPLRLKKDGIWPRLQEFMACMARAARGRWVVSHIDMHSNMDALSAIRSPERTCMDLLDEPESIDRAMKDVRALYPEITDALYRAGNMAATGSMGWIAMYCETKFNVTQCDFICMIGNEMFRRFVLPALAEETEHLGHSVYHLDGPGALRHLDDLLALPKLNAIQWVPGAGNKPLPEWLDVLRKIQAAGKSLHVYGSVEEIKVLHRALDPRRCFYDCWAKNEAEARGIVEWLKKNT
jgi:hypothetical protein